MGMPILAVRVLLVDNHSSFTYNLYQYLAELLDQPPMVVRNDQPIPHELSRFDCIVLSPGPGTPKRAEDMGISRVLLDTCDLPILGVCLGHQGLGYQNGAQIVRSKEPRHGRLSTIIHDGRHPLFAGIPKRFSAVRYHSLQIAQPLPDNLSCIASADDGTVMAIAHQTRLQWGVQFHPESFETEYGRQLLSNFCVMSVRENQQPAVITNDIAKNAQPSRPRTNWHLHTRVLTSAQSVETLYTTLYRDSDTAFWIDGTVGEGYSFFGDASSSESFQLRYNQAKSCLTRTTKDLEETIDCESFFDFLAEELASYQVDTKGVPFEFCGGFVGYFGYELGRVCKEPSPYPDAHWLWVDRFIAFDHSAGRATLVAISRGDETDREVEAWFDEMAATLRQDCRVKELVNDGPRLSDVRISLRESKAAYQQKIDECKEAILAGESYELCLTSGFRHPCHVDSLELFLEMRRSNPAPYAAYLKFSELAVVSTSPERFLHVGQDGRVESKPIKGTARRSSVLDVDRALKTQLQQSEKERAENLMIVDLVRNDLGRCCEIGSVRVESFAAIESFPTVHQLVSTIVGQLREDVSPLHCVRDAFPAGSMTGAPKERAMHILEALEGTPRGIYSGSLGYISLNGAVNLSVVIRTVIVEPACISIGVGGAITVLSDSEAEYDEIVLKSKAIVEALIGVANKS